MKNIFLCITFFLLLGCKTTTLTNINGGIFVYKYKDGVLEELILNEDSSFVFNSDYCKCIGFWKYIANDSIYIKCNGEPWTNTITRSYMTLRERKIKVVSENKLKIPFEGNGYVKRKYLILERVKEE